MTNTVNKPFLLQKAYNVRELGGYVGKYGAIASKAFLRSDNLSELDDEDITMLLDYGVKVIIDLRSTFEVGQNSLKIAQLVNYFNVPMFDKVNSHDFSGILPETMAETYIYLLEEAKPALKQVFELMLNHKDDGVILFNCTAGKDRTGIVAMLLLRLAGIDDQTIIEDYKTSGDNNKIAIEAQIKRLTSLKIKVKERLFYSYGEDMQLTLKHLDENFDSLDSYFLSIGLKSNQIETLRQMMIKAKK